MSIYVIITRSEYGKQGEIMVHHLLEVSEELSGEGMREYAHSLEQAMAFIKSFPAFANVDPYDYKDGRFHFVSQWTNVDDWFGLMSDGGERYTHTRLSVMLAPVDTIYEKTTPKTPAVFSLE